ncbi:hypothetical protein PLEOSDRAFT_1081781 [Pleurotus ostreatus PC15]|uniref:Uncharacterized protein n=1 Tax=Pleurotus ostreatus (strain PC15) TaxID=1137138 RepID=A0A067NQ87_PLEO1|nr:hypothetical protein PLEOSDRAFT_1081781 [Pleurotus ostreatus PC15]
MIYVANDVCYSHWNHGFYAAQEKDSKKMTVIYVALAFAFLNGPHFYNASVEVSMHAENLMWTQSVYKSSLTACEKCGLVSEIRQNGNECETARESTLCDVSGFGHRNVRRNVQRSVRKTAWAANGCDGHVCEVPIAHFLVKSFRKENGGHHVLSNRDSRPVNRTANVLTALQLNDPPG